MTALQFMVKLDDLVVLNVGAAADLCWARMACAGKGGVRYVFLMERGREIRVIWDLPADDEERAMAAPLDFWNDDRAGDQN